MIVLALFNRQFCYGLDGFSFDCRFDRFSDGVMLLEMIGLDAWCRGGGFMLRGVRGGIT